MLIRQTNLLVRLRAQSSASFTRAALRIRSDKQEDHGFPRATSIMSVGIPIKLLHEASPHIVTVEMRTGDVYRGTLSSVEDNMNVQLKRVTYTRVDGKVSTLEHIFIRGSKIRFFILPDILANAPMFKRVEALKEGRPMEARGLGRGRGIGGVASRPPAVSAGRGRGFPRGPPPRAGR